MSFLSRNQQWVHVYNPQELAAIVGESCTIKVGGLVVDVKQLAEAGWWCKFVESHHGSRVKLTLYGGDKRSIISLRAAQHYKALPIERLFEMVSEATLTVKPQVIRNITPDLELLTMVENNIRRRIRRQRGRATTIGLIEKAERFANEVA